MRESVYGNRIRKHINGQVKAKIPKSLTVLVRVYRGQKLIYLLSFFPHVFEDCMSLRRDQSIDSTDS